MTEDLFAGSCLLSVGRREGCTLHAIRCTGERSCRLSVDCCRGFGCGIFWLFWLVCWGGFGIIGFYVADGEGFRVEGFGCFWQLAGDECVGDGAIGGFAQFYGVLHASVLGVEADGHGKEIHFAEDLENYDLFFQVQTHVSAREFADAAPGFEAFFLGLGQELVNARGQSCGGDQHGLAASGLFVGRQIVDHMTVQGGFSLLPIPAVPFVIGDSVEGSDDCEGSGLTWHVVWFL
jgi:hypothetical protein